MSSLAAHTTALSLLTTLSLPSLLPPRNAERYARELWQKAWHKMGS